MTPPIEINYDSFPIQIEAYGHPLTIKVPALKLPLNEVAVYHEEAHILLDSTSDFQSVYGTHTITHNEKPIHVVRITPSRIEADFERTYNPRTDIYEAPEPLWTLYRAYC